MHPMLIALIFVLLPYQGLAQTWESCPIGFTYFPEINKCYMAFFTKFTWNLALITCQNLNSHLATLLNPNSNNALNTVFSPIRSLCMNSDVNKPTFWSAGKRKYTNGTFGWVPNHGSMLDMTYTNWVRGEPDNRGGHENCVHVLSYNNRDLLWNDISCLKHDCFICQIDL